MTTETIVRDSIIYIAGYGRSGSTLLDVILNDHPQVFGAGELTWLFAHRRDGVACSCGRSVSECPFWDEVLQRAVPESTGAALSEAASITLQTERFLAGNRQLQRYRDLWRRVHQAIRDVSGKPMIVDSSKSNRIGFRRLPLLMGDESVRSLPVHLVRDPRAVMWSLGRGTNRRLEADDRRKPTGLMARGLASWTFSNVAVELLRRRTSTDFYRLRYEDLASDPQEALAGLGTYLDLDLSPASEKLLSGGRLDPGHGIAGNRMRRSGAIKLRLDDEWVRRLPAYAKLSSNLVWPLKRTYRYTPGDGGAAC